MLNFWILCLSVLMKVRRFDESIMTDILLSQWDDFFLKGSGAHTAGNRFHCHALRRITKTMLYIENKCKRRETLHFSGAFVQKPRASLANSHFCVILSSTSLSVSVKMLLFVFA